MFNSEPTEIDVPANPYGDGIAPPPPKSYKNAFLVFLVISIVLITISTTLGIIAYFSIKSRPITSSNNTVLIGKTATATQAITPTLTLPTAIQIVDNYQPSQEYASITWKTSTNPQQADMYPYPISYAEFDICFGAGGSGCSTVLYTLAVYQDISVIAETAPIGNSASFLWSATLGHCVLQSQGGDHASFLGVESDFMQLSPC